MFVFCSVTVYLAFEGGNESISEWSNATFIVKNKSDAPISQGPNVGLEMVENAISKVRIDYPESGFVQI